MRKLKGTIVSNKMVKTVVVQVDRLKKHPKYLKYFKASTRLKAHVDDAGKFQIGDVVIIQEARPFSKEKRWKVMEVVKRGPAVEVEEDVRAIEMAEGGEERV